MAWGSGIPLHETADLIVFSSGTDGSIRLISLACSGQRGVCPQHAVAPSTPNRSVPTAPVCCLNKGGLHRASIGVDFGVVKMVLHNTCVFLGAAKSRTCAEVP